MIAGPMYSGADYIHIEVADNGGFLVRMAITEKVNVEQGSSAERLSRPKLVQTFIATDVDTVIRYVMDYAPRLVSGSGMKCCGERAF